MGIVMKSQGVWAHFSILVVACLFSACSAPVQQVPASKALAGPREGEVKSIEFRKAADTLAKGELVGKSRFGVLCLPGKPLAWRDGRINVDDEGFSESFRREVEKVKIATVSAPAPVVDTARTRPDLLVLAQVSAASLDVCSPWSDFGNWRDAKGGAYLKVQWQVYSQSRRKVVYETSTEGSVQSDDSVSGGASELVQAAFASATQNFLADPAFFRLLYGDAAMPMPVPSAQVSTESLRLAAEPPRGAEAVPDPKLAVMGVIAGLNRGSGFVVSTEGYLITSERVVRGQQLVKLKSATGQESLGFVVRRDVQGDLALVKLTERNAAPVALRTSAAVVNGEEVYVLGTPASRSAESSLRRGTIRPLQGTGSSKLVQSTIRLVSVDAGTPFFDKEGKVVGVAIVPVDDAMSSAPASGLLPIAEALARLSLNFKP
jgi:S1-C subfamily serine protease